MLKQEEISNVIDNLNFGFSWKDTGLQRELLQHILVALSFATIIKSIRRSGKSTLLLQLLRGKYETAVDLHFDDIRLSAFETGDFVAFVKNVVTQAIQVCLKITIKFFDREYSGLKEAMLVFNLTPGQIVTLTQSDNLKKMG